MAVADRTLQILPGGQGAAPFSYVLPASTSFTLLAVRAVFDGSASASAWLPCVQIVSDAGVVMAQTVGSSVAAGASADVTFAPFLEAAAAATGGSGLQYDTYPQTGDWFEADATSSGPGGFAWQFNDPNDNGTWFNGNIFRVWTGNPADNNFITSRQGTNVQIGTTRGHFLVQDNSGVGAVFKCQHGVSSSEIGFFNVLTVPQQARPVTLADVINLLIAYGLSA